MLTVEVVYALPAAADSTTVELAAGATLRDAIAASGVLDRHPEIRIAAWKFGIFGKSVPAGTRLANGDRVEVYRPLAMDPKEARRKRAASEKKKRSV